MRIGIVSDIHGNAEALDIALERMGSIDRVFCAGDAFSEYSFSNDVVSRLREIDAAYVLGNHEVGLLSPNGIRAQNAESVDQELLSWVRERPYTAEYEMGGKKIFMFHSTPWEPYREYVYPHSKDLIRFGDLDADFAIYGHTHFPIAKEINGTIVINPGSVGEGRDPQNGHEVSYAILNIDSGEVEFDSFPNPLLDPAKKWASLNP